MARGFQRLFAFIATIWCLWWTFWFIAASADPARGDLWLVFMLIGFGIFSLGYVLTFLIAGFRPRRRRVIDL